MIQEFQKDMVNAWKQFAAGEVDSKVVKGFSSHFGIYPQRNDLAMMRIRRPGGIVTTDNLRTASSLLAKYEVPFAHITTRQAIQLHGVKPADVPQALSDCEDAGFYFRGGGGDTFRNTLVNRDSGLHADTAFDVLPYARKLSEFFYRFDTAYHLPRKIKIGFADREADKAMAQIQDLGFVAKVVDGKRAFETYFAGGIGFKPRIGIKLCDALPAEECVRLSMALTRLFNDKGCRTNRMHARIRFLREDFGDEELTKMLLAYYEEAKKDCPLCDEAILKPEEIPAVKFPVLEKTPEGFELWKKLAVTSLGNGMNSVRVFVPYGNFTSADFNKFAEVLDRYNAKRLTILISEDFAIAPVPDDQLAGVYSVLVNELGDRDYTMKSFVGHITTCIGFTICKSGAADSPMFGTELAKELDKYLPLDTSAKIALAKMVLDDLSISGCPNSCTTQVCKRHGFICRKHPSGLQLVPFTPGAIDRNELGVMKPLESKPIADIAAMLAAECGVGK